MSGSLNILIFMEELAASFRRGQRGWFAQAPQAAAHPERARPINLQLRAVWLTRAYCAAGCASAASDRGVSKCHAGSEKSCHPQACSTARSSSCWVDSRYRAVVIGFVCPMILWVLIRSRFVAA